MSHVFASFWAMAGTLEIVSKIPREKHTILFLVLAGLQTNIPVCNWYKRIKKNNGKKC
jgi:uncharacterized membrane protein